MLRTIGSMALGVLIGIVIAVVCEVGHIFYADVVHNSPCVMRPVNVSTGSGVMTAPMGFLCPPDTICQSITQHGGGIVAEGKSVVNVSCVDNLPCVTEVRRVK